MIFLKVRGSKSWLDPQCQRALTANLTARLWGCCQGRRGLFVTLTYRRDEYNDALDLYRTQAEQQHVPLFLRKVARYLGQSLKGRWFCKMEFQAGGWVHWHIIILDIERIPHDKLTELWGRGHVWIRRLSERNIRYCCKYVAKDGHVPEFLYDEKPKSVKIVRVSPGFWGDSSRDVKATSDPPAVRLPFWKTIGQRIKECRQQVVVRDTQGHARTIQADFGPLLADLMVAGHGIIGNEQGWVVVDAELKDVERLLPPPQAVEPRRQRPSDRGGYAAVHLTKGQNPDTRRWAY